MRKYLWWTKHETGQWRQDQHSYLSFVLASGSKRPWPQAASVRLFVLQVSKPCPSSLLSRIRAWDREHQIVLPSCCHSKSLKSESLIFWTWTHYSFVSKESDWVPWFWMILSFDLLVGFTQPKTHRLIRSHTWLSCCSIKGILSRKRDGQIDPSLGCHSASDATFW